MKIPYDHRTALYTDIQHGWVTPPATRGTASILYTCLITITLCVYSSLHLNIPAPGEKKRWQYLRIAKWVMIGMVAPEIVLWVAYTQYTEAKRISNELNAILTARRQDLSDQEATPTTSKTPTTVTSEDNVKFAGETASLQHLKPFDLTYGFFVVMGGIRTDISCISEAFDTCALNRRSLISLATHGHFIPVEATTIADKSKANVLAKCLVILQVSWMLVQCIARKATGLPLSLLELHTFIHALCAGVIYALWFKKPLGIGEATSVSLPEDLRHLVLPVTGLYDYEIVFNHCDREQRRLLLRQSNTYLTLSSKLPEGSVIPRHPAIHEIGEVEDYKRYIIYHDDQSCSTWINTTCVVCEDRLSVTWSSAWLNLRKHQPLSRCWNYDQKRKCLSHRSWNVGDAELTRFKPVLRYSNQYDDDRLCDDSLRQRMILTLGGVVYITDINPWNFIVMFLVQAAYGGIHLSAWSSHFSTVIEMWFWRSSCLYIAGFMLLDPFTYLMMFSVMCLTDLVARKLKPMVENMFVSLCRILMIVAVTLLPVARVFVVVEAFISLRAVPIGVFAAVSWADYIPHL